MRTWIKSACVVLAWSILPVILVAAGMKGSVHPAQANTRTAGSTEVILTSIPSVAAAPVTAASHTTRYVVQDGDTLSGIAARFAVRGGWPALYAANRRAIGPDPNLIHSGTVLVLPAHRAHVRYTVTAGDTLSGIAAEFAARGGWPALYVANRRAVGPDPNVIHAGIVLTIPRPAAPSPSAPGRAFRRQHPSAPRPSVPAGSRLRPLPVTPTATGMPQWLKTMLVAVGLLILAAFAASRCWWYAAGGSRPRPGRPRSRLSSPARAAPLSRPVRPTRQGPASRQRGAQKAHIILADHHRLIVTCNKRGDTVYVLRPPGEDAKAILKVARLVVPEGPYGELADQLGVPASWPME